MKNLDLFNYFLSSGVISGMLDITPIKDEIFASFIPKLNMLDGTLEEKMKHLEEKKECYLLDNQIIVHIEGDHWRSFGYDAANFSFNEKNKKEYYDVCDIYLNKGPFKFPNCEVPKDGVTKKIYKTYDKSGAEVAERHGMLFWEEGLEALNHKNVVFYTNYCRDYNNSGKLFCVTTLIVSQNMGISQPFDSMLNFSFDSEGDYYKLNISESLKEDVEKFMMERLSCGDIRRNGNKDYWREKVREIEKKVSNGDYLLNNNRSRV